MRYQRFNISNYKAVKNASLDLSTEGLVLLLGINESGKTSVLRAIESFDHTNDPENEPNRIKFYKSIRNKKEIDSKASITAQVSLEKTDIGKLFEILKGYLIEVQEDKIKNLGEISIIRNFIYQNAEFVKEYYKLDSKTKSLLKEDIDETTENNICKQILTICPSIQYFEDFKDQIPDFISLTSGSEGYNADWASTIEGLFFHADPKLTAEQFQNIADPNSRQSALNKVNLALNKQFTNRWNKKLKGTKTIHEVKLVHDPSLRQFTFTVVGADKTTVFAIDERSKGALWYFTFLLKTEFRKRKLRSELGKTLYLIDEPGSNLHSSAQINMVFDFRTLASDSNVIYTTHSQYLIDKENLSNVYIVEYSRSIVRVIKYQQYLQGKDIKTSYYQPIIDALEIQPFSLEVIWNKIMIVEGVYDYCGYKLLFEKILKNKLNFTILPGTGASGHGTLISLHIGWGAKIIVLLDNDEEGRLNKDIYISKFPILKDKIRTLDLINSASNIEFEDLFSRTEKENLTKIAGFNGALTKKVFQQSLSNILYSPTLISRAEKVISSDTKNRFKKVFDIINQNLKD